MSKIVTLPDGRKVNVYVVRNDKGILVTLEALVHEQRRLEMGRLPNRAVTAKHKSLKVETEKKVENKLTVLTDGFKAPHTIAFTFMGLEINIAQYAVTKLISQLKDSQVVNSTKWTDSPTTTSFEVDFDSYAKVYNNIVIYSPEGQISAVLFRDPPPSTYRVELLATTEEQLIALQNKFLNCLETSNFYKGKCLKFTKNEISFMPQPKRTFDDVVLPKKSFDEYYNTVVDFLLNPDMQEVCKKRRVLLYGPPGTGKTSLVSATFNHLSSQGITCVSLNEVYSMNQSIEEIFSFILKYLAPAYIIFEDIDLIGFDRNSGMNSIIGRLLSLYDGIEDFKKAVVLCSTTNRMEILDKAFTRPCRMDRRFHLGYLTEPEMDKLFHLLLNVPLPTALKQKKLTGSHIQEIADTAKLLSKKNGNDPTKYVDEATKTVLEHFYMSEGKQVGFNVPGNEVMEKCAEEAYPMPSPEQPWHESR